MSKIYTYEYDSAFNPSMPTVEIEIGPVMALTTLPLTILVDSGADATLIPMRYLQQIRARRGRTKWMRGTTGGRVLVSLYPISLKLGSFVQSYLEVVGDTSNDEPILGRDNLNHLSVNLNGPAYMVEISLDA